MGDVGGYLVEGESRNQTNDPVRNFQCHRCEVGIAEDRKFRKPIKLLVRVDPERPASCVS